MSAIPTADKPATSTADKPGEAHRRKARGSARLPSGIGPTYVITLAQAWFIENGFKLRGNIIFTNQDNFYVV